MPRTMNDPWRNEGDAALAAAPAPAPAPYPNNGSSGRAGGSGEVIIQEEEEEETLGQLRDRQALASARASAPGPRAVFVHIKVEDTDGEGAGGGDGEDATDGEGLGEGVEEEQEEEVQEEEDEEEEEEEEEAEEEEREEGQQREQHTDAGAGEVAPPRRARPPPWSYADAAIDYDEEEEDDEDEEELGAYQEEEEAEPRDQRARESVARTKGGRTAVRPQRRAPGARSEPGSPRARLQPPGRRVADNAIQYNGVQQQVEDEAGVDLVFRQRVCAGPAGSYQFKGVTWHNNSSKWMARYQGKHLGLHTTEVGAARAYSKYLEDGIDPVEHRANTSRFAGVSWHKYKRKWAAQCKGKHLGRHATEEAAAQAYNKYLEDGIDPVDHREASTSQFTGVSWDKSKNKWRARCKGKNLSHHVTETDAARAYNVEAARVGLTLNVIPPAGAAGAGGAGAGRRAGAGTGPKRVGAGTAHKRVGGSGVKGAAPKTSAALAASKKMKR